MFDARAFFCDARDAAVRTRDYCDRVDAKRQLAVMRARGDGPTGRGGVTDPTRRIDDYVDLEASHMRGVEADRRLVRAAKRLLRSYARMDPDGARVVALRYVMLMGWRDLCGRTGLGYDEARTLEQVAFDRMDSEGPAAIMAGVNDVTGAEG